MNALPAKSARPRSLASVAAAAWLLAACASAPESPPVPGSTAKVADEERVHCTREIPVGTQMPVTRCRTMAQIERDRAEAAQQLNTTRQAGPDGVIDRSGR